MKNFGFRKLMIFIILSATVGLAFQMPYLRTTYYDQMMTALQINDTQMGILASAIALACTVCYPISGLLANRFSMRSMIMTTLAAYIVLCVTFAFTTNFIVLVVIQLLFGFFSTATLWSAYLNGVRGLGDESIQGKLFGSSEATRGLMQTLMGFVFLAIMGGAATPILGLRFVMLTGAAVIAVVLILAFFFLPKEEKKEKVAKAEVEVVQEKKYTYLDVIKNKGVWISILLIFCAYTSWTVSISYVTTYTVRVVGISEAAASTVGIFRNYIIVILAGFMGGWLMDKFTYKGKGFIALLSIVAVLLIGVMLTNKSIAICVGLTLLLAFFINVMKSTYWSTLGQAGIPAKMTPLATGFISLIVFLPDFITPLICGPWLDAAIAAGNIEAGFHKIFIMIIVVSLVGVIGALLLVRRTKALKKTGELEITESA